MTPIKCLCKSIAILADNGRYNVNTTRLNAVGNYLTVSQIRTFHYMDLFLAYIFALIFTFEKNLWPELYTNNTKTLFSDFEYRSET